VIGAGLLLLSAWTEQTSTALQVAGLIVQGIGLGLFQLAYADIVTSALPLGDRGVAGSLTLLTRMFGTSPRPRDPDGFENSANQERLL